MTTNEEGKMCSALRESLVFCILAPRVERRRIYFQVIGAENRSATALPSATIFHKNKPPNLEDHNKTMATRANLSPKIATRMRYYPIIYDLHSPVNYVDFIKKLN